MKRLFLLVSSLLYLIWIVWLTIQVGKTSHPIVVSHPQFNVAPIIVVVELGPPQSQKVIGQVVHVYRGQQVLPQKVEKNTTLNIVWPDDLCGWHGPGTYLLALQNPNQVEGTYQLVPVPFSPGYRGLDRRDFHGRSEAGLHVFHVIYPWTESVKQQVELLLSTNSR